MIDTHCHLTYDGLHERVEQVVARAHEAGVDRMISVGTTPDDAQQAIALAQRFDRVYATVGLHPGYAQEADLDTLGASLGQLATHQRVVALGEMGLDRHYPDPPIALQRKAFAVQLELLGELDHLPAIIHNRQATDDTLAMIADHHIAGDRLVFHCFTGEVAEVDKILALGAMVSFTGIVTFNSAQEVALASDRVPMDRLMIETDSPYLTPVPYRKVRPNEPQYVREVARFLAQRRSMETAAFVEQVDANAKRFFKLPD